MTWYLGSAWADVRRRRRSWLARAATLAGLLAAAGCSGPAAGTAAATQAAPPPVARPYVCRFTEAAVIIDGSLTDEAWGQAVEVDGFTIPWLESGPQPPAKATRAKLLWDRENLYVAADMDDADLYADVTTHDGQTWDNDVFEVFLKPNADKPAYYEFQVNAANTRFDCFNPRRGHVRRFKSIHEFGIESAVKLRGTLDDWTDRDQGWSVELRIPWKSLVHTGGRPKPGAEWRFALCRYDFDVAAEKPELSTSAALSRPDFHRHEEYRPLVFEWPREAAAGRPGIPRIVPVTTSRVAGSPEPVLPYRAERAHPEAKLSGPITVTRQPGSDRLLYVTEPQAYAPSTVMRMPDDERSYAPEVLVPADDRTVHYAITFHPEFAKNGYVFIGSNGVKSPDGRVPEDGRPRTRITRYEIDREPPYTFHRESATVIIEWDSNGHNGGDMAFAADGTMFVGSGDGTSDSDVDRKGQDLTSLRAKILRIDPDHPDEDVPGDGRHYSVPRDNPIFDRGSPIASVPGARPETWAYGLRQPWRLSFDAADGRLWVANQGQDLWEQIYVIERGANYGWSILEGTHPFHADQPAGPTPFSKPVVEHSHSEARALTGGLVYTGTALPELRGAYLYGDYATGRIWGLRHDGTTITRHELLADTTLQITGFGIDSHGEILICDHQPREQGGFYRLVPAAAAAPNRPPFPRTLSETGLFTDVARHRMADGVIPFAPAAPQWSDGAEAVRFLALPPATDKSGRTVPARIDNTNIRGWGFPDGTVLVQSFAVDRGDGDPASRRWIETRLMLKEQKEWAGYSYAWNDEQTDADLVAAEGADREIALGPAGTGPGAAQRTLHWRLPSRTECLVCHSRASNYVLGLSTVQLNHDFDYEAALGAGHAPANQLATLEHLGLLKANWSDPPAAMYRLANPFDPEAPLEARARSYLQANCAACHVFAGGGNARIDMEYMTASDKRPLEKMHAVGEKPLHTTFELPDARLVAGGHAERSVLFARMSRRGPGQMPPLGTTIVDERGLALIRQWIESLAPTPKPTSMSAR